MKDGDRSLVIGLAKGFNGKFQFWLKKKIIIANTYWVYIPYAKCFTFLILVNSQNSLIK